MSRLDTPSPAARLQEGWVIANHILVSFHVAFISSVLALPHAAVMKGEVLRFIFVSPETLVSALFMYVSFHVGIAIHELGHLLAGYRLNALNAAPHEALKRGLEGSSWLRWWTLARLFFLAPFGKAVGIKKEGLNYYIDAPYNLAVAAAGPMASRRAAGVALPLAAVLLALGLLAEWPVAVYAGRLCLGIGVVTLLDFFLADPGKYAEFRRRESEAARRAARVEVTGGWYDRAPEVKARLLRGRMQKVTHPVLGPVTAPWQFRNCGMGGRHTEKEYPESNISMQEAMFLILGAQDYQEAQEWTVRLQTRLKEIIENAEGCRVMGIGLEGGLAPYIEKGEYPLPEVRLWAMMKQAILECGFRPGVDVALALDPAMSELENAYRQAMNLPDAVGMYLFWRDKTRTVLDRDGVLDIYVRAIREYDIPILSIEDGFSERDPEGWRKLLAALGDRIFIIGDDLVTTNDRTIEEAAAGGLINTALIKANQIGTLYETLLAMLVALGKGQELVVSHRSKSPNDDMEAQIALAANTLGLKAGGGANTERLVKYQAVAELMGRLAAGEDGAGAGGGVPAAAVDRVQAYEEPTNAGVPTVGATVQFLLADSGVRVRFRGATPLGTSAGTGEAIHLVDSLIEAADHREVVDRHRSFFREVEPGVVAFRKDVTEDKVLAAEDEDLLALFRRAQRYGGKGCLNAVDNVANFIAPAFVGREVSELSLLEVDRTLLRLELRVARERGKVPADANTEQAVAVMQRKQNLGMNAILSVSLALARGLAQLRGRELYELLREEMMGLVERVAAQEGVALAGSAWEDYVAALREVGRRLEKSGRPLYEALREVSGLYAEERPVEREVLVPPPPLVLPPLPEPARRVLAAMVPLLGEDFQTNPHHGLRHAEDLLRTAALLAGRLGRAEEVDWEVLAAAACLHDVGAAAAAHGEAGAVRAEEVLHQVEGFSPEKIARVATAVRLHEDRSEAGRERRREAGLEAQLLYDADQLEAFGVKGVYRYVSVYTARGDGLERIPADLEARYQSLSFEQTRRLAAPHYRFARSLVEAALRAEPPSEPAGPAGVVAWVQTHHREEPASLAARALATLDGTEASDGGLGARFFRQLRETYTRDGTAATPAFASLDREVEAVNRAFYDAYAGGRSPCPNPEKRSDST